MKKLSKYLRLFAIATAAIFSANVSFIEQSQAGGRIHAAPVAAATSSTSGIWIIGGLAFSVASIIACAMIVGAEEGREMTLEEALLSGAIPLGCLLREELGVTPQ